jgi:hypothetical protein
MTLSIVKPMTAKIQMSSQEQRSKWLTCVPVLFICWRDYGKPLLGQELGKNYVYDVSEIGFSSSWGKKFSLKTISLRHARANWEWKCSSYSFLTTALVAGEWSASHPGPRFTPDIHWTGGWVGYIAGLDTAARRKILCHCRESNPAQVCSPTLYWLSYTSSLGSSPHINYSSKNLLHLKTQPASEYASPSTSQCV